MKEKKAFTLLEILIVVIIISILVSMSLVSYAARKKKSEYDGAKAIVNLIAGAEKNFFMTTGAYQDTTSTGDTNAKLSISIVDGYFHNYRVSTSFSPFVVLVDAGNCAYTFDSNGTRTGTNGGSDCLP